MVAAIAVVTISLLLAASYLNEFPAFIHAWAQADWYSIAIGFINNGFDFFHPETLIYNKQFPDTWSVDYGDTLTSADFPVHEYIVALLMHLFGSTAPWVFRGWTLLCSLAGMWMLYLLSRRITGTTPKALLVTLVAMTSPLYAYYFAGFLPCVPALALVIAGVWAYVKYHQEKNCKYWHLAIALLGLATLMRTSQAVSFVAVCGYELLRILRKETAWHHKWIPVLVAMVAIGGYLTWNSHLAAHHGTLFLNRLVPPRDWEEVDYILQFMREHWRHDYFSQLQHLLVALVLVIASVALLLRRRRSKFESGKGLTLGWLAAIWWLGELCFFVAMMRQYEDHDYYFLDNFFLPVLFTFALALGALPQVKQRTWLTVVEILALILLAGPMFNKAKHSLQNRRNSDDRAYVCSQHFEGADRWLDSQGVSRDAKILAFMAYPQNGAFLKMGRKGYSVMWWDDYIVEHAMQFPFDYVVMENEAYAETLAEHPTALKGLLRVAEGEVLSLFIKNDNKCISN